MKCSICTSPNRDAIDGRLAIGGRGNSLRRIAADFGFSLRVVWSHSHHRTRNESSGATAADRELLRHWTALHKKALRDGALDTAARCLQSIAEIQARIELQTRPKPQPGKQAADVCPRCGVRVPTGAWLIRYEDAIDNEPLSSEERDNRLLAELADAVERHQSDERFIASTMRLCAILKRERLPAEVEAEIDRLEENDHGDTRSLPRASEAEGQAKPYENGGA